MSKYPEKEDQRPLMSDSQYQVKEIEKICKSLKVNKDTVMSVLTEVVDELKNSKHRDETTRAERQYVGNFIDSRLKGEVETYELNDNHIRILTQFQNGLKIRLQSNPELKVKSHEIANGISKIYISPDIEDRQRNVVQQDLKASMRQSQRTLTLETVAPVSTPPQVVGLRVTERGQTSSV